MLVCWLLETPDTIPENASHRVGIGAFVMNSQREVCIQDQFLGDQGIPVCALVFYSFHMYIYIYMI